MNYISIEDISFSYNENVVFENFSAKFPVGEFSAVMSPSGRGKTTLLYLIAGLLTPSSGSVSYPHDNPVFSMVFQDDRLIDSISASANIKLVNSKVSACDIDDCLGALGLGGRSHKKVRHLSGGERQRVAIARALLADYDILLLDEPFTGLDDDTKKVVIEYIKSRTVGKTVLLVTHDKTEAELCGGSVNCLI